MSVGAAISRQRFLFLVHGRMISSPTIRTHTAVSIFYYFRPITDAPIKNTEIWFTFHKRKPKIGGRCFYQ
jgi:hypothetical protein